MHIQSFKPAGILPKSIPAAAPAHPPATPLPVEEYQSALPTNLLVGGVLAGGGATVASLVSGAPWSEVLSVGLPCAVLGLMAGVIYNQCRVLHNSEQLNDYQYPTQPSSQLLQMVDGSLPPSQLQEIQWSLSALGTENAQRLVDGGLKIVVDEGMGARYDIGSKLVKVGPGSTNRSLLVPLVYALDDAAVPDTHSPNATRSGSDAELAILFKDRCESIKNDWNPQPPATPQDYLARGVSDYLSHGYLRRDVTAKDPHLAHYIGRFLKDPSQG